MKIAVFNLKRLLIIIIGVAFVLALVWAVYLFALKPEPEPPQPSPSPVPTFTPEPTPTPEPDNDYIKWVDFNIPYEILETAMEADIASYEEGAKISWIDILSFVGAKCGGNYSNVKATDIYAFTERIKSGETLEDITKDMKYFNYYKEAYGAVLSEYLGEYSVKTESGWHDSYGLKVFSPIASGYEYSHYDDFGASRSYGYKRKHLGHDIMGRVGTPVIAVESGVVESLGWNQYGGWRIGIRSYDKKRYYYYAHLRKDHPYHKDLKEGAEVKAGDVIGYLGMTGYSTKENVNNIDTPHLHFGIQLIFDESQKDGVNQIWIDLYDITKLLYRHRATVIKNEEDKEYYRMYEFMESFMEGKE